MISVIVPVYNVEPYLRECLDSIINQTYHKLEIIIINDGSTDGSQQICEEYRKKDDRIRLFHTENRGQAAARNLGLDNACGEWIMFVDSDDFVSPDYCEIPLQTALMYDADLVIFERKHVDRPTPMEDKDRPSGLLNHHEAVRHGYPAPWNKLYQRDLFRGIRYPEGRVYEDIATTHRLIYAANRIVRIDLPLYFYRYRKGRTSSRKDQRAFNDLYIAHIERYQFLLEHGYPREIADPQIFTKSLDYLERTAPTDTSLYHQAEEIVATLTVDTDKLSAHARNCLKIWNANHALLNTVYRLKHPEREETPE